MSVQGKPRSRQEHDTRGDRLYPHRSHRVHWLLTRLRIEIEGIISQFLRDGPARHRLVDFGCGNMPYRPLFEPVVGTYLGCDLAGNEAADLVLEAPDSLPFESGSVDILLSTQVLEHCVDPERYLAECWRVLSDGGIMILSTHGVWRYHPDPLDLWRWTSQGLKQIVHQAGFTIPHFRGVLGPAATGLQIWQDAVLPRVRGPLHTLFVRALQNRIRAADLACSDEARDADAGVFILAGRKGSCD